MKGEAKSLGWEGGDKRSRRTHRPTSKERGDWRVLAFCTNGAPSDQCNLGIK